MPPFARRPSIISSLMSWKFSRALWLDSKDSKYRSCRFDNFRLEEQKAQDRFLRGRQIACMIYDYFEVTGAHDTVWDYADLFSVTLHDDNVQELDTRWDENLLSVSKIPSDDILESLYKLRIRESDQLKTRIEIVRLGASSEDIMSQLSKVENDGAKKYRSETPVANFRRQTRENRNWSSCQESKGLSGVEGGKGTCYQWKEKGQCSKGNQCSFRHEITIVHNKNRTRMPLHPPSHQ